MNERITELVSAPVRKVVISVLANRLSLCISADEVEGFAVRRNDGRAKGPRFTFGWATGSMAVAAFINEKNPSSIEALALPVI